MEKLQEIQNAYAERFFTWMEKNGYEITREEVQDFCKRNIAYYSEIAEAYMVVVNNSCQPSAVRHIAKLEWPYDTEKFAASFYEGNPKLDGDEFVYCPSGMEMFNFVKDIENRGKENG